MIEAIEKNLQKGIVLLNTISNEEYTSNKIPPYFSSIGCHIRHLLDVFSCVLEGLETQKIDLTARKRNLSIEQNPKLGIAYINNTLQKVNTITENDLGLSVEITDDLGLGKVTAKTTFKAMLMQAQTHAIHHFASIGCLTHQLGIQLPNSDFGYNPTTPK